ncbi:MAG: PilZ domain-containing protein [Candidatus Omnitrophica bacterium]|nr:PilZ domain-containing protein [Candidatus Omnitrophota bacterium]
MDIVDLKQVKQFSLECKNKTIIVYLLEIGKNNELIFKPDKPNPEFCGKINENCCVFFEVLNKTWTFSGKLFCPTIERFIVVNRSSVMSDRRRERRFPVPSLAAHIKETGVFHHLNIIDAHAMDLTLKGIRIQSLTALQIGVSYEIEVNIIYKHQIHIFKSNILIKDVTKQGFNYYCGGEFINTDEENKHILEEYLLDIQGKLKKDFLNVENLTTFSNYFINFFPRIL